MLSEVGTKEGRLAFNINITAICKTSLEKRTIVNETQTEYTSICTRKKAMLEHL